MPTKSGTAQKVVPFSWLERPHWFLVFQLLQYPQAGNLYQFQAHGIIVTLRFSKQNGGSVCVAYLQLPPSSIY